jgi:hypothetical protein
MRILGNCGHCGKSIQETKKTCGATYVTCKKCKTLIHPHCIGEHRLMHRNQELYIKQLSRGEETSFLSRIVRNFKNLISTSKE